MEAKDRVYQALCRMSKSDCQITAAALAEDAKERTIQMLNVYDDFCEQELAIPVIKGQKTEKEKFAGAKETYTIESMMHDGKALQSGTSHNFGDGFAKAFGIQYLNKENEMEYVHQTSWGMSTRIIGAIIMVHGDDAGLKLPPRIAPVQAVIIPVAQHKPGVLDAAAALRDRLSDDFRVKLDDSEKSPGWKFSEYEMRGVPVRIEIGPKDIEKNQAVLVSRVDRSKTFVSLDNIEEELSAMLDKIQQQMYDAALENRKSKTSSASDYEEFKKLIDEKGGFVKAMWCGSEECELKIKEDTTATSRCIPFEQEHISDTCICCGKPADKMVYWGRAY